MYEDDIVGIHTIELETGQPWTWTSTTVSLNSGGLTTTRKCCYWWYLTAGPSMSNGGNSSHVWANGKASYICHNSEPTPFCIGNTPQYPMTFHTWLHMYPNGVASATGTSYSGTVIPGGNCYYEFWVS